MGAQGVIRASALLIIIMMMVGCGALRDATSDLGLDDLPALYYRHKEPLPVVPAGGVLPRWAEGPPADLVRRATQEESR